MRRFPPPWTIEERNNACFIVRDATGQALGYFYFEEGAGSALGGQAADPRRGAAGIRAERMLPAARKCPRSTPLPVVERSECHGIVRTDKRRFGRIAAANA
jgi:hypothetical protein